LSSVGFLALQAAMSVADRAVTSPLFSWTLSGDSDESYAPRLVEFRPADGQTVIEMMDGKYLLGGTLVDTGGVSPFALRDVPPAFFAELHSFGWLRHFSGLRDAGQRRFAATLVSDWIGRHGSFSRTVWAPALTARRVLNWLKNIALLTGEATPEQQRTIRRVLASQIQSLNLRQSLIAEPSEKLLAVTALAGAALCGDEAERTLLARFDALERLLDAQIDDQGLHLSRNPHTQLQLLSELIPLRPGLARRDADRAAALSRRIETMQRALDRLILTTSEPGYFNGCGQLPVDLVLAVTGQSNIRTATSSVASGYGVLVDGHGKVIADSGLVPPAAHAGKAHAGGLSFEFSCGNTLVAGNCGPAPGQLPESSVLFRHTAAHSAPTVDDISNAHLGGPKPLATRLRRRGGLPSITLDAQENTLELTSLAYAGRYGLLLTRRLTLMGGGHTLVGQDRLAQSGRQTRPGDFIIRFHLAPGATADRTEGEDLIRITYRSGEAWTFLWEGAHAEIEESVRNSRHFGLSRTEQIVLNAPALPETEIAWVFTRQSA